MSKNKFFVVWKGKQPGIYPSWEECSRQVHQFEGAKFKGFATEKEAQQA
ncbi:MAG: RNase H1/viroplasmin domain-containing protein, partial [Paludibacteraceae bacterium]|nr:RNase H1/viroplasmin domain-containing protein [Paludibacteraceae bacterium]